MGSLSSILNLGIKTGLRSTERQQRKGGRAAAEESSEAEKAAVVSAKPTLTRR